MKNPASRPRNFLLLLPACLLALAASAGNAVAQEPAGNEIMFGVVFTPEVNGRKLASQVQDLKELGVSCAKFWLDWNQVEPKLAAFDSVSGKFGKAPDGKGSDLSLEFLRDHPQLVEEYAFPERPGSNFHGLLDWSLPDRLVKELNAAGIAPLPLIGDGAATPAWPEPASQDRVSPEPLGRRCSTKVAGETRYYRGIGREPYLAHVYLMAAGMARRYAKDPDRILWWNTENELNWAYIHTTVAGWRCGKEWSDRQFLAELLAALYQGIKAGNPEARSAMNLNIHDPKWVLDLKNFAPEMDGIGLGAYPNYLFAWPVLDGLLNSAVGKAVRRSQGKPVLVLETGYPAGPKFMGWNENLQARYVRDSVRGAVGQGAKAYIYFKLDDTDLAISAASLQRVENHWGLVRLDGSRKPAFQAYQKAIADCRQRNDSAP